MTEGTPSRYCQWIARDDMGRPRCEHGWAMKTGPGWRCPEKRRVAVAKYRASEKGRAAKARWNASEKARAAGRAYRASGRRSAMDALYDLTRVR